MTPTHCPRGFTLLELLAVIVVMSILAAAVLTSSSPGYHQQLQSAARAVAAELHYARSLAETSGSRYEVGFDLAANRLLLRHSGDDASLHELPQALFRSDQDTLEQHVVDLDELDCFDGVSLHRIAVLEGSLLETNEVEFGPLGETTAPYPTLVWLAAGREQERLYLLLVVNPVTGLTTIGERAGHADMPLIAEHAGLRNVDGTAASLPNEGE